MSGKSKTPDPTVQAAEKTSRRALKGTIIAAIITAVAVISAATINSCGGGFKPSPLAEFVGRVRDNKTQEPIKNAKVSLSGEGVPPVRYTDAEGVFRFTLNDPTKNFLLHINIDGYEVYDLNVVPAKNQVEQDIRLTHKADEVPELSGIVVDRNDKPIQGAKATLDDLVPPPAPIETSSDGTFTIKNIPRKYGEMVRLRIAAEGYQPNPYTEDVVLGKTPPRIKLARRR